MGEVQFFFSQLNQFFDKIYVITLQRAADRQAHVRNELQGLDYEFFFGKDKQSFSINSLKEQGVYDEELAKKHHRYGKAMHTGQIGAAWSHAEVYKDVVENNYRRVFIMEDDIVIDKEAIRIFPNVLKELPADWELLYLGFDEREKAPPGIFFKKLFYHFLRLFRAIKFSHTAINHLYPRKVSTYIYEAGYHDCIHAYGITHSAAKKMLALQKPISFIADNLPAHAITNRILKGYIVLPKIINQQYQIGTSSASYINDVQ
jgi:glycosyl transferase family 25